MTIVAKDVYPEVKDLFTSKIVNMKFSKALAAERNGDDVLKEQLLDEAVETENRQNGS